MAPLGLLAASVFQTQVVQGFLSWRDLSSLSLAGKSTYCTEYLSKWREEYRKVGAVPNVEGGLTTRFLSMEITEAAPEKLRLFFQAVECENRRWKQWHPGVEELRVLIDASLPKCRLVLTDPRYAEGVCLLLPMNPQKKRHPP